MNQKEFNESLALAFAVVLYSGIHNCEKAEIS